MRRFICFALAGLFLLASASFEAGETEINQGEEEYTAEEFEEYLEWETNDYYKRDLRNGVIVS